MALILSKIYLPVYMIRRKVIYILKNNYRLMKRGRSYLFVMCFILFMSTTLVLAKAPANVT